MKTQTTLFVFAPILGQIRALAQSVMDSRLKQKSAQAVVFNTLVPIRHCDQNK